MFHIRPYDTLSADEIRRLARDQADSGDACMHGYAAGSREAAVWERAYMERRREVDAVLED